MVAVEVGRKLYGYNNTQHDSEPLVIVVEVVACANPRGVFAVRQKGCVTVVVVAAVVVSVPLLVHLHRASTAIPRRRTRRDGRCTVAVTAARTSEN